MKIQSSPNLVIKDFVQCIPEPKRRDYELLLLHCNFSDPSDPLFPIVLFLLFVQDSLSERSDTLAEEFSKLRMVLETGKPLPSPSRSRIRPWWKITVISLLIFQVLLGVFGLYRISAIEAVGRKEMTKQSQQARSLEIQKINHYWDNKIEHIKDNKLAINLSDLIPEDMIGIVVTVAVIFVILLLLQIILTLVAVKKFCKNDDDLKELEEYLKHCLWKSASSNETHHYLDPIIEPLPPKFADTAAPDIPEADVSGWGEAEEPAASEDSTQTEGDNIT